MKPKLAIIKTTHRPVDITALLRAEIEARDWERVHVTSHRSAAIELPDRPKRSWWK
jgi:hypothetical protein